MKKLIVLMLLLTSSLISYSQEYEYDVVAYRSDFSKVDSVFNTINDSVWFNKNGTLLVSITNEVIFFDFLRYEYYGYNILGFEKSKYGIDINVSDTHGDLQKIEVIEYDGLVFFTVYMNFEYITLVCRKFEK